MDDPVNSKLTTIHLSTLHPFTLPCAADSVGFSQPAVAVLNGKFGTVPRKPLELAGLTSPADTEIVAQPAQP
jgi:hypothetical protein